jgi:hypothetical protein
MTPTPTPAVPFGFRAEDWQIFEVCASALIVLGLLLWVSIKWWVEGGTRAKR